MTVVHSEYAGRGELLPYVYYLKYRIADRVVILHDSVFLTRRVPYVRVVRVAVLLPDTGRYGRVPHGGQHEEARPRCAARCADAVALDHAESFSLGEYEGATLRPSGQLDFRRWYERYVGPWEPDRPGACWNAIVRTTGRQIRKRPRSTYVNVYTELALADGIEAVHFVERCVHALLT